MLVFVEPSPPPAGDWPGRPDDERLLRGAGAYVDDLAAAAQAAVVCFVRSPHAHARLAAVEAGAIGSWPGVLAVWTAADLQQAGVQPLPLVSGLQRPDGGAATSATRHVLAGGLVRHVGEPVAAVVACTARQARAAAEALQALLCWQPLPAVADAHGAQAPQAPRLCEDLPDNVAACLRHGDAAATQAAFDRSAHRVCLDVDSPRVAACPMEPRVLLALPDVHTGGLTVQASTQMASPLRSALLAALPMLRDVPLRVRTGDVGGGFGMKTVLHAEDVVTCLAAWRLQRPVRWQASRSEDLCAAPHARDVFLQGELALDAEGRMLALRLRCIANIGAYAAPMAVLMPLAVGPMVATGVYDIPQVDIECRAVLTHTAPVGPYRGAGQPEVAHLLERLVEAAARQLGMDAAALRRRNMVRPQQMPYRSACGQVIDSGQFARRLDDTLALADWAGFERRATDSAKRGRLRGRGLACFLAWTGAFALSETLRLRVDARGWVAVVSGAQEMGQGIAASLLKLAAGALGLPASSLRLVQGDTDEVDGFGSGGSRSLFMGGAAMAPAAAALVQTARELAAQVLEAPLEDIGHERGLLRVAGTDAGVTLFELAARQPGGRFEAGGAATAQGPSWPNACHACEVEVDPATGEVQVVAYSSVNDIGHVVDPVLACGQIDGAVAQGIGQALWEQLRHDAQGQLLTGSLMDYALPRAADLPDFRTRLAGDTPCLTNGLGAKGAGELGAIGATPAVVNAVVDALLRGGQASGAPSLQVPLTADRVWACLAAGTRLV
ncbi:xanthine dehydrogenase family protein molybdopterin-binding subunit [Aquincola sp. J276]|uniref:xanthine dehydrogenase family protein molybdopterin-binding subunit n=1 Tax=Aquincola sp. J276 TaxID=2898432 RepID=UPI0021518766|nr:xanthine dehydrogenase family protein molybdopterin-binding subunit [Aquincola sp. J276]MCR5864442.1 xanthine dehydrogenase family protein molybdopterin-binding subunit [Aquincola sp. J276]